MALSDTCLFASLDEVKPYLRLTPVDIERDVVLAQIVEQVSGEIERKTGRVFRQRTVTEVRDGHGRATLVLRAWPVISLTTFTIDDAAVTADAYVLEAALGTVTLTSSVFAAGVGNVGLTYTAGYSDAARPPAVLGLALDMIKLKWDEWLAGATAATSIALGAASMVIKPGWPYQVRDALTELARERVVF